MSIERFLSRGTFVGSPIEELDQIKMENNVQIAQRAYSTVRVDKWLLSQTQLRAVPAAPKNAVNKSVLKRKPVKHEEVGSAACRALVSPPPAGPSFSPSAVHSPPDTVVHVP